MAKGEAFHHDGVLAHARQTFGDKTIGKRVVRSYPTKRAPSGMDALFGQVGIYAAHGQLYERSTRANYSTTARARTAKCSRRAFTEAGSMASFISAATSYSVLGQPMIPFYIFYSIVRLPAHGRPIVGGRRLHGARLRLARPRAAPR